MRLTIDEYAQRFQMSTAMVHAKLHAGRLEYVIENGTTRIVVGSEEAVAVNAALVALYRHCREENLRLRDKIERLETRIDGLIADKERMLAEERDRIEKIYRERDEQFKKLVELAKTEPAPSGDKTAAPAVPAAPATLPHILTLDAYFELRKIAQEQAVTIRRRFARAYGNDIRILQQNGEFLLDFDRFDYSDLLVQ